MFFLPTMVMPDEPGSSGDGPGDPDGTRRRVQAHVLIASAFGFASGLTFVFFFLIFHFVLPVPAGPLGDFFVAINPNILTAFLYGLIFGTFIALVYNGLTAHHFNIFNTDAEDFA
jgi:hypothetical protein